MARRASQGGEDVGGVGDVGSWVVGKGGASFWLGLALGERGEQDGEGAVWGRALNVTPTSGSEGAESAGYGAHLGANCNQNCRVRHWRRIWDSNS